MKTFFLIIFATFLGCVKDQPKIDQLTCHFVYNGEKEDFKVTPTKMYEAKAFRFHAYFRVKLELLGPSTLKVYIWAPYDDQDKLIHQSIFNFQNNEIYTGKHFVYEPDAETGLSYWCDK